MLLYEDLKTFFARQARELIIVADAAPRVGERRRGKFIERIPAGGVAVSLDPIAKAGNAIYIARGRNEEERNGNGTVTIKDPNGSYRLRRLFLTPAEFDNYYNGFANQTLWPLCHVTFERPEFHKSWFEGYKAVNIKFAKAVKEAIAKSKKNSFVWINDYHLALVPKLLDSPRNTTVAMFWHIPWPTWEAFRILPFKKDLLESMLRSDFIGFHRGYHVRNFLDTVGREFEARIDEETSSIYFNGHTTVVKNLPMGIDTEAIASFIKPLKKKTILAKVLKKFSPPDKETDNLERVFDHQVILGVDRLDYTKGLLLRFAALDRFLEKYPQYKGKITYFGIMAPSRGGVPAYQILKRDIAKLVGRINKKYQRNGWEPIVTTNKVFDRPNIINFYQKAKVCLVTPRDDGMNLVSKEFVLASSYTEDPGMLVLSRFAGSAIDLTESLIVNPYDIDEVADAIKRALAMDKKEKITRIKNMAQTLLDRNIYDWAKDFVENALDSSRSR